MSDEEHTFTYATLKEILDGTVGQTLGAVDSNHVFERAAAFPKMTGIAGDVIEQSVLGYPPDSRQEPDLVVDGKKVELKTTGIRESKTNGRESKTSFEAKEPMSITAVSPKKIVNERFENSNFWHKLERLLLVYYHYDSKVPVKAPEYASFVIEGYDFYQFDSEDRQRLMQDWLTVQTYIQKIQAAHPDDPEKYYPSISSALRPKLMMIDTAPKWPHPPRFRLKRATVSKLVQEYFGKKFEKLKLEIDTMAKFDQLLHQYTETFQGKTTRELMKQLDIPIRLNKQGDVSKSIGEQIITRMFGAHSAKMNGISLFKEIAITARSVTQSIDGNRTEDTKLTPVDFEEWSDPNLTLTDASVYNEFHERQFLFIIFKECSTDPKLLDNKFVGFKRLQFSDEFIDAELKSIWIEVRKKIFSNNIIETIIKDKSGQPRINKKSQTVITSVNFPKSADHTLFFRGTGTDATDKPITLNGIKIYRQNIWIKGTTLIKILDDISFI